MGLFGSISSDINSIIGGSNNTLNGYDAAQEEVERLKKDVRAENVSIQMQTAIIKGEVSEAIQNRKREIENKYKIKD